MKSSNLRRVCAYPLAVLLVCIAILAATVPASASASRCQTNRDYSSVCATIIGTGLYVNYMTARVHLAPLMPPWKGHVYFKIDEGFDFYALWVPGSATYAVDFQYRWNLNQSFASKSQACEWFYTDSGYYNPGSGPICFTIG